MNMRNILRSTWVDINRRCHDPRYKGYRLYGSRGIFVCDRWRNSFEAFANDMGPRPEKMSIDRIDNNGPYSPDNCRWADIVTQNRNKRTSIYVEYKGKIECLIALCASKNMSYNLAHQRLKRGWTVEAAINIKAGRRGNPGVNWKSRYRPDHVFEAAP